MDRLLNVLQMTLPVFVMIFIGFLCKKKKILSPEGLAGIKALVSNILLPTVLFNALATAQYSLSTAAIFLVIVAVNALTLFIGYRVRPVMGEYARFSPFFLAGGEIGMLGYALFALLVGNQNLFYLASVDLGNILFCFSVYLALLLVAAGGKPTVKDMVANVFRSPCFIGALLGLVVGVSGLGGMLFSSKAGGILSDIIALIISPTSALILIVVGYEFMPDREVIRPVLKITGLRMLVFGAALGLGTLLLCALLPIDAYQLFAILLYWALPAPMFIPIYANSKDQGKFISTSLSLYMVVTLLAFTAMAVYVSM